MKFNKTKVVITTTLFILLIPFVAMQFTKEVDWSFFDFLIGGILLFGAGMLITLVIQKVKSSRSRLIISALILIVLMLIWAELAVGIFGTPLAGS